MFNSLRASILDEEHKVVMLWTPKAGCTTAVAMMFQQMNILQEALAYNPFLHHYRMSIFYDKYGRIDTEKHLASGEYTVLKVIRDPYERAVSCYLHTMKMTMRGDSDISFEQFLLILRDHDHRFVVEGTEKLSGTVHSVPQYVPGEEKYITKYIRIENATADLAEINLRHGLHLDPNVADPTIVFHHTPRTEVTTPGFLGKTPFRELPSALPRRYDCFYDDTLRNLVARLYSDDILHYAPLYEGIPRFDATNYLRMNPDLGRAGILDEASVAIHWKEHGLRGNWSGLLTTSN